MNQRERRRFEEQQYAALMGEKALERQRRMHEQFHTCDCDVPGRNHTPECSIWKGRILTGSR